MNIILIGFLLVERFSRFLEYIIFVNCFVMVVKYILKYCWEVEVFFLGFFDIGCCFRFKRYIVL